jgi:hypothetical protein
MAVATAGVAAHAVGRAAAPAGTPAIGPIAIVAALRRALVVHRNPSCRTGALLNGAAHGQAEIRQKCTSRGGQGKVVVRVSQAKPHEINELPVSFDSEARNRACSTIHSLEFGTLPAMLQPWLVRLRQLYYFTGSIPYGIATL